MRIDRSFKHYTDGPQVYLTSFAKYFQLLRLDAETQAWEMHMHGASAFIGAS